MVEYAVEMHNISKQFPLVLANDDVTFSVQKGEIHALVGENGAGKSTLMNILYGLLHSDSGTIAVNGKAAYFLGPGDCRRMGQGRSGATFGLPTFPNDQRFLPGCASGSFKKCLTIFYTFQICAHNLRTFIPDQII